MSKTKKPSRASRRAAPPCSHFDYRADRSKMPSEKPAWEMTAEEFADNPPSREWFNWFGWPEGYHYCNDSRGYALQTGYPCCIKKAMRDGHIANA
jgi:hypothetical protein